MSRRNRRGDGPNSSDTKMDVVPTPIRKGRIGALVVVSILGFLLGGFLGGAAQWANKSIELADQQEEIQVPAWEYSLPKMSEDTDQAYAEMLDDLGKTVAKVLDAYPADPNGPSALGVLHYLAHDRLGEEKCWERCLVLDPLNGLAHSRLIALAQQNADYGRIVELMRRSLKVKPDDASFRGMLGSALMHLNQYDEAKKVLESLVHDGGASAESYLVLGEVYNQLDELTKSKRYLEAAVALAPDRMNAIYSLAKVCAKLGYDEEAAEYRKLFDEQAEKQRGREAGMRFRNALKDDTFIPVRAAEIMTHVGKAYSNGGEDLSAEKFYLRAAEVCDSDIESRKQLSELYSQQGRLKEALKWVQELKKLAPENHLHYRNEGILYSRMGQAAEAEKIFRDLYRLHPTRSYGYAALAELYLRQNRNLEEARRLIKRAVELEPTAGHFIVQAAIAEKTGDQALAKAALQRAKQMDATETPQMPGETMSWQNAGRGQ